MTLSAMKVKLEIHSASRTERVSGGGIDAVALTSSKFDDVVDEETGLYFLSIIYCGIRPVSCSKTRIASSSVA